MPRRSDYKTLSAYQAALSTHMRAAGRIGGAARAKALDGSRRAAIASLGGFARRDSMTPEQRSAMMRRAWVTRRRIARKGGLAKQAKWKAKRDG